MRPLRIMLVDDHEVVRLGLKALLSSRPGIEVVAEAETAWEAVSQALSLKPDVVIMDIRLPGSSGIEACRRIKKEAPEVRVIFLTAFPDDENLLEAIEAGADGYVLKRVGSAELLEALEKVRRGENVLDSSLMPQVFARLREVRRKERQSAFANLTERELQILALIARGKSNREIAEELFLSEKTVRNYVSQILGKLGLSSRAEAAVYAVRHGIESLSREVCW